VPAIAGIIEPEAFVFKSDEAMLVIAKLEVVAFEVVALRAVKFWRVEDADDKKPPVKVERPVTESELRVPTDVRDDETTLEASVVPVSDPAGAEPVILPVRFPVPLVKKRLVVEARVEKKAVVVA
jgi:hypothetical protein